MLSVKTGKKHFLIGMLFIMTIPFFIIGYFSSDGNIMCVSLLLAWLFLTLLNCSRKRLMVFAFCITFFAFLLGDIAVKQFDGTAFFSVSGKTIHAYLCLFLSLHFLNLGVLIGERRHIDFFSEDLIKDDQKKDIAINRIRDSARVLYVIFGCCQLATAIEKLALARILGSYTATYINFSSSLPGIIIKLAEMADIAFFIYLATIPNPKKMKIVVSLKVLIGVVLLAYGMRSTIVMTLIIMTVYFILYEEMKGEKYSVIPRKAYIIVLILMPVLLTFLDFLMAYRDGRIYTMDNIWNSAKHMITSLGGSVGVIESGYEYSGSIPHKIYSLGGIISFFKYNIFSRLLFGAKQYGGNTVEQALHGNSFSNTLTFIVNKDAFLRGFGMGSSYIAEVFHDFGYLGVCVINIIYGYILTQFNKLHINHVWKNTIMIMSSYYIIYAPRAYADSFISCFLNFSFILVMVLIWVITKSRWRGKEYCMPV